MAAPLQAKRVTALPQHPSALSGRGGVPSASGLRVSGCSIESNVKSESEVAELNSVGLAIPPPDSGLAMPDRQRGYTGSMRETLVVSSRSKQLCVIILAQSACVAVGLWMQHQYVKMSVLQAAEDHARAELTDIADKLVSELGPLTLGSLESDTAELERVQALLRAHHRADVGTMIIDREWRVVARGQGDDLTAANAMDARSPAETGRTSSLFQPGQQVMWEPSGESFEDPAKPLQGKLALPTGPHIAAASALDASPGYVVVYRSEADVEAASAALVRTLPALCGMAFLWTSALLSIIVFLFLGRYYEEVERERIRTSGETLRRSQNLVRTRDAVIFGLAKLADSRDPETGDHLDRMSIYSTILASALQRHPKYADNATPAFVKLIGISTALHDIGKVGIEDSILRKPGKLNAAEMTRIHEHAAIGGECLREIELRLGSSNFLQMAREIAIGHHERWDGAGYPWGIAGNAIPLSARIAAIADVYDALSSKRVYKAALPHDECVAIIRNEAGKAFDPDLVEVWLVLEQRFREIASQYASESTDEREVSSAEKVDEPGGDVRSDAVVAPADAGVH